MSGTSFGCIKLYKSTPCLTHFTLVTFNQKKITHNIMAKTAAKSSSKAPVKRAAAKKPTTVPETNPIVKSSETALKKLKDLGIESQLQADLEWCLGSYKNDNNPIGLYEMVRRAVAVFKENKNTKGVTAKLITDLEKSVA
jgi:hypothetical protein